MTGIDFIGPSLRSAENQLANEIARFQGLPKPYRRNNRISEYLSRASFFDAFELGVQNHRNHGSGEMFRCLSYYSEDEENPARASKEEFGYVVILSAEFIRRLVKISSRLEAALDRRPRASSKPTLAGREPVLRQDRELNTLLAGDRPVSEPEGLRINSKKPPERPQIELGSWAVFCDLMRLIWLHEWAHALCGHLALLKNRRGISTFSEFSTKRSGGSPNEGRNFAPNEIMQALEVHADEFAVRYCIDGILWRRDPVAEIAGPRIDLVDRLLIFNVACSVFTIVWALEEAKYSPDDTFYPPALSVVSDKPSPIFVPTKSSHPPAVLRYDRLRAFQRELSTRYAVSSGHPELRLAVDSFSFDFLRTLGEISGYFPALEPMTVFIGHTHVQQQLEAYGDYLVEIGASLTPELERFCYLPTSSLDDNEPS